jgi:integration host factor subunit beta
MSVSSETGGDEEEEGLRLKRRAQAESLVIAVLDEIAGALERGKRMELRGVGVLTVKEKRERQGRNPRTGEALVIEPHRIVHFRASELLLARLNRPDNRRPERPKSDPRQLAFSIDGRQGELSDTRTRYSSSLFIRKLTTGLPAGRDHRTAIGNRSGAA